MAVYHHLNDSVAWYNRNGVLLTSMRNPLRPKRLPESHVRLYLAHQAALEAGQGISQAEIDKRVSLLLPSARSVFPESAPSVVAMLCDGFSRVWLQPFHVDESPLGYGDDWTILNPHDMTIENVRVPLGVRVLGARADALVGVRDTDDGFQEVVIIEAFGKN